MIKRFAFAILLCAITAAAQVQPILQPHQVFLNSAGFACAGCSLYSYTAGTTSPLATYTDSSEGTQNQNPVVLGTDGGANIWVATASAYKFVLEDTTGTVLWTADNVTAIGSLATLLPGWTAGGTGTSQVVAAPGSVTLGGALNASTVTSSVLNMGAVVTAKDATTLASAISSLSSGGGIIALTAIVPITANTIIPAGITISAGGGTGFSQSASYTLTINGTLSAEYNTVFYGFSSGQVLFNSGATDQPPVYAGWWQNYATHAGAAISAAIASLSGNGGKILLPAYGGVVDTPINATLLYGFGKQYVIDGAGTGVSILYVNNATYGFDMTGSENMVLRDFQLVGQSTGTIPLAAFLLARSSANGSLYMGKHRFENVVTTGSFRQAALYNYGSEENRFINCFFRNNSNAGGVAAVWITSDNASAVEGLTSSYTTISTGGQSTSENRFIGDEYQVTGTGVGTDVIRMRGALDNISFSDSFFFNGTGRSYFFMDLPTGTVMSNISVQKFRAESGVTPSYFLFGASASGTGAGSHWSFRDGSYDVQTDGVFFQGTNNVQFLTWKNMNPDTNGDMVIGTTAYSDLDVNTAATLTVNGDISNSSISYDSTWPFTVTGANTANFWHDRKTGTLNPLNNAHGNGASQQMSDGTGASGHLAKFDANGNATDSGIAATAPSVVATCGTTTTCANTAQASPRAVWGTVALSSNTPSTAVVTGMTAFTATTSYACTVTNLTTAADGLKVANTSITSITITGPNTVTDTVSYICVGN